MELFLFHFRQTGWTLKQEFLCTPAYGTVDPENMEAILSSKFHGKFNLRQAQNACVSVTDSIAWQTSTMDHGEM